MQLDSDELFKKLRPDVLITFGGLIVSKKVKAFLRKHKPDHHWHIGGQTANNTFFCLKEHLKISVNRFFDEIYAQPIKTDSDYFLSWNKVKQGYMLKREVYLKKIPFLIFQPLDSCWVPCQIITCCNWQTALLLGIPNCLI